jgi:hypothetical protein
MRTSEAKRVMVSKSIMECKKEVNSRICDGEFGECKLEVVSSQQPQMDFTYILFLSQPQDAKYN